MKTLILKTKTLSKIIRDFRSEMSRGLLGKKSSLAMIPTFAEMPTESEKGEFLALDLGGTNFRILNVVLRGCGKISVVSEKKFHLKAGDITGTEKDLFGFIAASIKRFMEANKINPARKNSLGFTFSFPLRQISIADGILLRWNKGFAAKNCVGKNVVQLLNKALLKKGLCNIKVAALINDTLGTLVTRRYADPHCDMGVILGTGTNASYLEKVSNIKKNPRLKTKSGFMAINIEWGNFNKLPQTIYDKVLDEQTINHKRQRLEKMVSGMYLGELVRLIILDMIKKKILFGGRTPVSLAKCWKLTSSHVSLAEGDDSRRLGRIAKLLRVLGIKNSTYRDRLLTKEACVTVSTRSAQISASAIAAVILWMYPKVRKKHTVAIDGSLFEKWPQYRSHLMSSLRSILKEKAQKISLILTKDGSGKGAAVVAATALK